MEFNKSFFDSTRLGILSKAALVLDAQGNTLYLNRPFMKLCRTDADIKREILSAGFDGSVLFRGDTELFGDKITLCAEKGNTTFPVYEDGNIYFLIEGTEFYIKLPLFGGKVITSPKNDTEAEPIADMSTDYFPVDIIFERIVRQLKEKCGHKGRRIELGSIDIANIICRASVFDISLIVGLLVEAMYGLSSDKTVNISAGKGKGYFVLDLSVETDRDISDGRFRISEVFNTDTSVDKSLVSLENFCSLFSYAMMCRKNASKLSLALVIPVYNKSSLDFKNEDEESIAVSVDRAAMLF